MKWSETDISFGLKDHPETELSNQNLPFMVKLPIGRHNVAKTLIDNRASLNLIMRKTFIKMGLNLSDLTPVHNTFHGVIPGQLSTPIGHIDLEVSCVSGDNKHKEMLIFEVASFNIGYNCILERPFLLKFMAVIHTHMLPSRCPGQWASSPSRPISEMLWHAKTIHCRTSGASATRQRKIRWPRWPKHKATVPPTRH
jgi:hypothetical protein